jgi:hypothetical protein
MEIKVTGKLISSPRQPAHIYRLKRPAVTEKSIRALARQLGIKADAKSGTLCSDQDKLTYQHEHLELTVFRASGAIRLIDRFRWQADDHKSNLEIEDAAASRLATNVIKKYKVVPPAEMKFLKAARLRVGEANRDGGEASERTIDVAVAMQRFVNKIPVEGPGGKVIVYFNQERQLSGIERIWREIGPVYRRNQSHRSPERALEEMADFFRRKQGTIEVEEIRYGYFEDGWRDGQQYLQPAYVIFGMLASEDRSVRKRTIYVATALTNPVGRITPPLEPKRPQRPRPGTR